MINIRACAPTGWFWAEDGGDHLLVCIVGKQAIVARDANSYEVIDSKNPTIPTARVTRDEAGWHCSIHAQASERDSCFEIEVVLQATDGGKRFAEGRAWEENVADMIVAMQGEREDPGNSER